MVVAETKFLRKANRKENPPKRKTNGTRKKAFPKRISTILWSPFPTGPAFPKAAKVSKNATAKEKTAKMDCFVSCLIPSCHRDFGFPFLFLPFFFTTNDFGIIAKN